MKVLLLTVNAGKGGVVNVVWQLARLLRARGHEVAIASDGGSELPQLEAMRVRHYRVPFNRQVRGVLDARAALRAALRDFEPDIVHSHSRWPSMVSKLAGRHPDVSSLHMDQLTGHGSRFDAGPLRRWLSVFGRYATTLDEPARQMLIREMKLDPQRVVVLPNGVDESRFGPAGPDERRDLRARFDLAEDDTVAVYVGAMVDRKRPGWCIDALACAAEAGLEKARLLMVGDGDELPALRRRAEERGVADRCRFTGWIDPAAAYRASDVFVLASRIEGFALVCVEAMLCGLGVVRTRCGGWEQQILEGRSGWSVDLHDHDGFCHRVVEVLADPPTLARVGQQARCHALANFTERHFIERTLNLYDQALARRRGLPGTGVTA